jgi:hypothetical protein
MTSATFGDFLRHADTHIEIAAAISRKDNSHPAAAVRELHRVVTAMARYLDDRVPIHAIDITHRTDLPRWDRAVLNAHAALRQAADSLSNTAGLAGHHDLEPSGGPAPYLAAAAAFLDTGRDLLHTHATTTPDDQWEPRSDWACVVISTPVTRALVSEVARWSRDLAPVAEALAADRGKELTVCGGLQAATHWLWMAEAAVRAVQATEPVTPDERRLLRAIPAAHSPPRQPLSGAEHITELCAGITTTAERLRATTFGTAPRAGWAPGTTADTWRWTARAAAITTHASELLLRSLASHLTRRPSPLLRGAQLTAAADALDTSLAAWRGVGRAWTQLTTETRGQNAPVLADIGDLVLRTGRLTWNNPHWTPATGRGARLRPATDLTSHDARLRDVLGAIHHATDALACLAARDRSAVTIADQAERLYVRTRSLPLTYDVPRPYATAPTDRVQPLFEAYTAAERLSARAADVLGSLAITIQAPSDTLALARRAARAHVNPRSGTADQHGVQDASQLGLHNLGAGSVVQAVRDLQVSNPALLQRAAEIDAAAQTLIKQAQRISRKLGPRASTRRPARRPGSPATQLAAQDNPHAPGLRRSRNETSMSSQAVPRRPRTKYTSRTPRP